MSIYSQKLPKTSHILAIDFGMSKVGLALADMETKIAFAYGTISNDKYLLQKLAEIIEKESAEKVIIGVPSYLAQEKKEYAGKKLGDKLVAELKVKVEYQEEMFTTKMAQANIKQRGGKNIAKMDDQEAAKIILQDWLDKNSI